MQVLVCHGKVFDLHVGWEKVVLFLSTVASVTERGLWQMDCDRLLPWLLSPTLLTPSVVR